MKIKKPDQNKLYGRVAEDAIRPEVNKKNQLMNAVLAVSSTMLVAGCDINERGEKVFVPKQNADEYNWANVFDNSPSDNQDTDGSVC